MIIIKWHLTESKKRCNHNMRGRCKLFLSIRRRHSWVGSAQEEELESRREKSFLLCKCPLSQLLLLNYPYTETTKSRAGRKWNSKVDGGMRRDGHRENIKFVYCWFTYCIASLSTWLINANILMIFPNYFKQIEIISSIHPYHILTERCVPFSHMGINKEIMSTI